MKYRLIVMRHAKSDWNSAAMTDHERPLNARGRRDAPRIAERLTELGWTPQKVISSDSRRTTETWERMSANFTTRIPVNFTNEFYHAGMTAVYEAVQKLDDSVNTVLLLGHNPGWAHVAYQLTGVDVHLTTANAVLMHREAESWSEAIELDGCWTLEEVVRPKELD